MTNLVSSHTQHRFLRMALQVPGKNGFVYMQFKSFNDMEYYYTRMPTLNPKDENSSLGHIIRGEGLGPGVYNYDDFEIVGESDVVSDRNRHCYEVISAAQCPYADFDGCIEEEDINEIRDAICSELSGQKICVTLCNSNGQTPSGAVKYSYHIIVNGVYVKDHKHCEALWKRIIDKCKSKRVHDTFDSSVYTSSRLLRLYGSRKLGDNRTKVFDRVLSKSSDHSSQYINNTLHMTMSSAIEGSVPFDVKVEEKQRFIQPDMSPQNGIVQSDIPEIVRLVNENFNGIFKEGRLTNGILTMTRIKESYCPICSRTHSNSDAFVTKQMSVMSGALYQFRCYRNPKGSPILLNQDDTEEVSINVIDDTVSKDVPKQPVNKPSDDSGGEVPNREASRMIKRKRGEMSLEDYALRLQRLHAWK